MVFTLLLGMWLWQLTIDVAQLHKAEREAESSEPEALSRARDRIC